jgi:hypothetical protein
VRTSPAPSARDVLSIFREPVSAEKRALLEARWQQLPPELRRRRQVVGRQLSHCAYTLGASYCSFGCTHCYLPANANRAPLPSLAEMKAQIDANRRLLGHNGALQITGGDVVDAYFRAGRPAELIEIVRYANDAGVVPMLMTHGQRLLESPDFLERLVIDGRLRKLAVHIDVTQAGRPGFPIRGLRSEADLHPLRQQFVDLIHRTRKATGVAFSAAHTVTVTERNLDSVADVIRWLLADRRRLQAFGMLSLQPEAAVGRTRFSTRPVTPDACWQKVCEAAGMDLCKDHIWFGHPDCSHWITLAVLYPEGRVVNVFAGDEESRAFWDGLLTTFGGVGSRVADGLEANLTRLSLLARRPAFLAEVWRYGRHLLRREGLGVFGALRRLASGRVGFLTVVQHNFMSTEEVASDSEVVQSRLQACSFQGAVRSGDDWRAVPMCAMNAEQREDLYAAQIASGAAGGQTGAESR